MASAEKLWKGIGMLKAQGHLIEPHMKFAKLYWHIDCRIWATGEEIEYLADGLYSFSEFEEIYSKRGAYELSTSAPLTPAASPPSAS
jgi:hypothetical protein